MAGWFSRIFGSGSDGRGAEKPGSPVTGSRKTARLDPRELTRRLGLMPEDLDSLDIRYDTFLVKKRSGGHRVIDAPAPGLREFQRRVLHRILRGLRVHAAAQGFERGRSIATHARVHAGKAVVLRLDLQEFFPSIEEAQVRAFFERIGWDRAAAKMLTTWCTWKGRLPQGAPTSPRLSNLVNRRLDARLDAAARRLHATYSRYADDLTFSWAEDRSGYVKMMIRLTHRIVQEEGYRLHLKKKVRIMRSHDRQVVTGLVVNDGVRLPRSTRRWLRAVEHRLATGGDATLTQEQMVGWRALQKMVAEQGGASTR